MQHPVLRKSLYNVLGNAMAIKKLRETCVVCCTTPSLPFLPVFERIVKSKNTHLRVFFKAEHQRFSSNLLHTRGQERLFACSGVLEDAPTTWLR